MGNPKDYTKKLFINNKFNKVEKYKINVQKSVVFLYSNNKLSEKERSKSIPFTIASKITKDLRINLTEEVKGLYSEGYKTLMKEIKDTDKQKGGPCS